MTLEQLCEMDGKQLAELTNEQLTLFFEKSGCLNVTRPERQVKKPKSVEPEEIISPEKKQQIEYLKTLGVDLSNLKKPKRRFGQ